MKICDFVESELNMFRNKCNFTSEELQFFEFRAKDMSIITISSLMHISESKANRLSKQIKNKIIKVL